MFKNSFSSGDVVDSAQEINDLINFAEGVILICETYHCAYDNLTKCITELVVLIQLFFDQNVPSSYGGQLILVEDILPKLKVILIQQNIYFTTLSNDPIKDIKNKKEDFYTEKLESATYIAQCVTSVDQIDQILTKYKTRQETIQTDLFNTIQNNPLLITNLNEYIDNYYIKVTNSMKSANVNNQKIISILTSALTSYYRNKNITPNIVPFGSSANQLGELLTCRFCFVFKYAPFSLPLLVFSCLFVNYCGKFVLYDV
jgi:hypothetical protein